MFRTQLTTIGKRTLNYLDIVLVAVLLVCFAGGLRTGLIKQIFSTLSIAGGLVLGYVFYGYAGNYLLESGYITDVSLAAIVGFVLICSSAYLLLQLVSRVLMNLVKNLNIGWLNNLLGAVLGTVIGIFICYAAVIGTMQVVGEDSELITKSVLAPKIVTGYGIIKEQAPEKLEKPLERLKKFRKETWNNSSD